MTDTCFTCILGVRLTTRLPVLLPSCDYGVK
jgi:hypothetical protein